MIVPKNAGVQLVKANALDVNTAQTPGMPRRSGVSKENTNAERLWAGRVTGEPGLNSGAHHHAEAETAGYLLSGSCRLYFGDDYQDFVDMLPGDFVYVGPWVPHIEVNLSKTDPCEFVTFRTPANLVVNLDAGDVKFNLRGRD